MNAMRSASLTDTEAKAMLHDLAVGGAIPLRLLPVASRAYFLPDPDAGAGERTRFGLYQAVTHAAKLMPLTTRMQALQEVTSHLQPPA